MIERGLNRSLRNTPADRPEGAAEFVNPWAECWGSRVRCPPQSQMHADAAAPRRAAQMSGTEGSPRLAAGQSAASRPDPGQFASQQGAPDQVVSGQSPSDPSAPDQGSSGRLASEEAPSDQPSAPQDGTVVRVLPVINNKGLHARASAKFVQTVEGFDAQVTVSRGGETVGGLSIMGLMMLAAARGTQITVEARGAEAEQAMAAIEALLASKFGEEC